MNSFIMFIWVWFIGDLLDVKSHVVKEVTSSNHTQDYSCPMLVGCCGAPRGIVEKTPKRGRGSLQPFLYFFGQGPRSRYVARSRS